MIELICRVAVVILGMTGCLIAQQAGDLPPGALQGTPEQRAALQALFRAENSLEEMGKALAQGTEAGVSDQVLLEAQMLWGLRRQDTAFLGTLLPELEATAKTFDPNLSIGIQSAGEMKGWVAYIKALSALKQGDEAGFEREIKEAFWQHPASAAIFGQVVETLRREQSMADMQLDLEVVLTKSSGETTTLADELGGRKALLVDFWASWCGPCMALMPELRKKAEVLAPHGVVVMGMNTDAENAETAAETVRRERDFQFPWLVEPAERPYSKALGITSIPSMALVDAEGKVLFFGHPQDPKLWEALRGLDPGIETPAE